MFDSFESTSYACYEHNIAIKLAICLCDLTIAQGLFCMQADMGDLEVTDMVYGAPSSLKKTNGGGMLEEGDYASADEWSLIDFTSDLGLTLLPGHQTPKQDKATLENTSNRSKSTWTPYHLQADTSKELNSKKLKRSWTKPFPISPRPRKSRKSQQRSLSADDSTSPNSNVYRTPDLTTSTERSNTPTSTSETSTVLAQSIPSSTRTARKRGINAKNVMKTAKNILKAYSEPTLNSTTAIEGQATAGPINVPLLDSHYHNIDPAVYPDQTLGASEQTLNDLAEPAVCPSDETFDEYLARVFGHVGGVESEGKPLSEQLPFSVNSILGDYTLPQTQSDFVEDGTWPTSEQLPFFADDPFGTFTNSQLGDVPLDLNFDPFLGGVPAPEGGP
ncbi:hypothetical protein P7C71_g871, partial [Lecanoromycetidae sp. Uapishka_2]